MTCRGGVSHATVRPNAHARESMANERLVLVDGSWIIFRAYFAIPANFRTASGLPTNASYGFATMFRKLLARRKIDRAAVVFDALGVTIREQKYVLYKAHRPLLP